MKAGRLVVVVLALTLAGCVGAGPASSGTRARCQSAPAADDHRPLFFLFCAESP